MTSHPRQLTSGSSKHPVDPKVAIVTPIYKHSVLVTEAIESLLQQVTEFPILLILVNDGCPHAETDAVCLEYATAYPDRIVYLRKRNGGLSSARNYGIKYVLSEYPSIEAIYLLDADNRLRHHAIQRAFSALTNTGGCDWVYPNVDMFGVKWSGDYGGDYSLLVHTVMNICEAGSLIHRRIFDAGVFFDEKMLLGFEDWDFFLSAADRGFKGRNLEYFGLMYRKRPESMLADSHRDQEEIKGGMLRKHKKLMSPKTLVALEQNELPRYACYITDENRYFLTVDPALPGVSLTPEEFSTKLWRAAVSKSRSHSPAFLVVTTRKTLAMLESAKSLHWAFWKLEQSLHDTSISTLTISENSAGRHSTSTTKDNDGSHLDACMLMLAPRCLYEVLLDKGSQWINSITRTHCDPLIAKTRLSIPRYVGKAETTTDQTVIYHFLAQLHTLRSSNYVQAISHEWEWRSEGIPERARAHEASRTQFGRNATYPRITSESKHIGFLLPLVEFGGVEKVALNLAKSLLKHGWTPHLFVLETNDIALPHEWGETFSSVNFLEDESQKDWDGNVAYMGTHIAPWARHGDHAKAAGLMYWLDAVVNCHGASLHGMMGRLKRYGITTVASLHLSDFTSTNRPVGHTYLGLAYEHAYDFFAPCSYKLADWCHAMGIPDEKIIPVQNAPSYEIAPAHIDRIIKKRTYENFSNRPLRVLFLGRLDRQKGLIHLTTVMDQSKKMNMDIEWRIVGKSVIDDSINNSPLLKSVVVPPVYCEKALTDLYEWSDVLLLLSDYEGLPLTILEAMRLGVVTIATDVGAVAEILNDTTGFLVSPHSRSQQTLEILAQLLKNPEVVSSKALAAADFVSHLSWDHSSAELIAQLNQKYISKKNDIHSSKASLINEGTI